MFYNAPSRNGFPWTKSDHAKLRKLAGQGLSSRETAKQMGRSMGAVKYVAMIEGIRFKSINQPVGIQSKIQRLRIQRARRKGK